MDHKWGRNVSLYGLGDIGATLAARFLSGPGTVVLTNAHRIPGTYEVSQVTGDNRIVLSTFTVPWFAPHFPYQWGASVEPDAPV